MGLLVELVQYLVVVRLIVLSIVVSLLQMVGRGALMLKGHRQLGYICHLLFIQEVGGSWDTKMELLQRVPLPTCLI